MPDFKLRLIALAVLVAALIACGQKGPLKDPSAPKPETSASDTQDLNA